MATSPSDPSAPVPPEVVAIAVALAVTLLDDESPTDSVAARPPDVRPWRWQGWD